MSDALFDATPFEVPPPPSADPGLSADQRRTLRQREDIAAGRHPLTRGPLHEDAPRATGPGLREIPFTCGTCRFRELIGYHNRTYPKCLRDLTYGGHDAATVRLDQVRNVSHGTATDVRAWWPACTGYEAGDPTLSPDAARHIPEGDQP